MVGKDARWPVDMDVFHFASHWRWIVDGYLQALLWSYCISLHRATISEQSFCVHFNVHFKDTRDVPQFYIVFLDILFHIY